MKILKTAEQKNFIVDKDFYTVAEIWDMIRGGLIFSLTEEFEHKLYNNFSDVSMRDTYRIYADDCEKVKVIYDREYGVYKNIVVTKSGMDINIIL